MPPEGFRTARHPLCIVVPRPREGTGLRRARPPRRCPEGLVPNCR
ncbi:hypothetical protein SLNWT_4760 [Streptomyces albus]|uniref:Uncharacterized protein n=1 Tax=Streptomyces albus (strain ATCC 21838 / DSM 41398 / FERM P-419 / JCM 4703 / NBRC 107858) TaxID=1081613 RepID=A0A0B5F2L4_STRA4|nr:hypothetical protein SLNWT_4760 [Streptomyces albus]AOU79442.1 hypothetical protein SLNHY_4751 [Streptomyces albus]AYN35169.1 hypothetical protein DUI70_4670 [Streptomyces albus]